LLEGGIQPGLRARAFDYFETESPDGEITYKRNVSERFTRLDFGLIGGFGYKLSDEIKSMSIGMLYYHGLVDMRIDPNVTSQNTSLNVYMRIPIGTGTKD
jgi:hypothetical protein